MDPGWETERLLHYALLSTHIWWTLMRPIAARVLADEIAYGVRQLLEDERLLWERFPIEMDILERDFWAARAEVRSCSPPLLESPYRVVHFDSSGA